MMVLPGADRSTRKGILEGTGEAMTSVTLQEVHKGRSILPEMAGE